MATDLVASRALDPAPEFALSASAASGAAGPGLLFAECLKLAQTRHGRMSAATSASDAVDGSSTGAEAPLMWALLMTAKLISRVAPQDGPRGRVY